MMNKKRIMQIIYFGFTLLGGLLLVTPVHDLLFYAGAASVYELFLFAISRESGTTVLVSMGLLLIWVVTSIIAFILFFAEKDDRLLVVCMYLDIVISVLLMIYSKTIDGFHPDMISRTFVRLLYAFITSRVGQKTN